jgi:hypothetical protein
VKVHALAVQATPVVFGGEPQAFPHEPQLLTLFVRFVWQPVDSTPVQSAKPALHVVTSQVPPLHAELAFARLQTFAQAPQLFGSSRTLTHDPEQLVRPAPQVTEQTPAEQTSPPAQT